MFHKIILIAFCFCALTARAACTNDIGISITGVDGSNYCISKVSLNWWSAHSWCRAVEGTFASVDDACGPNWELDNCRNLNNIPNYEDAITATQKNPSTVYHLRWGGWVNRYIIRSERSKASLVPAICLMP